MDGGVTLIQALLSNTQSKIGTLLQLNERFSSKVGTKTIKILVFSHYALTAPLKWFWRRNWVVYFSGLLIKTPIFK